MNERNKLLQKLSAAQFAVWELHLYLDTHPCDQNAVALCKKHEAEADTRYNQANNANKKLC